MSHSINIAGLEEWYSKGNYSNVNNLRVFHIQEGEGPTLLCIHGFPSSSWDFAPIWQELTNHFHVLSFDLIGLGRSSKPNMKLTVALQADIIEGLFEKLEFTEAHILAHDLGDTVAQELLARQKEGSTKINWLSCILLNGGIFPETHQPLFIQKLLISPIGGIIANLFTKKAFRKNITAVFSNEHPPSDEFIEGTWQLIIEQNGIKAIPRLIRYMAERVKNRERWVQPLQEAIIPIQLINGVEDPISGAHMAGRFEEVIPNAHVVRIPNSGHYPHIETPQEVLKAIFEFHSIQDD
ncbi:alpha/beta fold hydrolase [Fulvivirga lutea]|uniref:Alpha/beta hydrolase n=1 Tax=Fulvivirga lutea TaxID=2810512 RepID=A0A975A092_9BACT|nr:alpha/beta hydrolase [Fulvivirga lutea]QSE96996.1 alpha/beta hydrolase [Fulvivirga lutea]